MTTVIIFLKELQHVHYIKKNTDFNTINLKSDKLLKKNDGYFINPLSFKDYGGSDSFFISALQKKV